MVNNKSRKMSLRVPLVLLLCVALLFMCVAPCFASVTATTIIVSAVVAAMSSFGVGTLVSGMTAAQISDWVSSELSSWASSLSSTVENLIPISAIQITQLGNIQILPSAIYKIILFVRWLLNKYNVQAGGPSVPAVTSGSFVNQPVTVYGSWTNNDCISRGVALCKYMTYNVCFLSTVTNTFVFAYEDGNYYRLVGVNSANGARVSCGSSGYSASSSVVLGQYSYTSNGRTAYYGNIRGIDKSNFHNIDLPLFSTLNSGLESAISYMVTGPQSLTLVPDQAITTPDYTGDDDNETPYEVDWGGSPGTTIDQAAQEILSKVEGNTLTSEGEVTLDPDTVTWPDIVAPRAVTGLDDIFPFCIPFDIYHFFQALVATPEAPHFEVPFVVPGLVNYTFVLDFAQFNTVAQIFRTMELLCFCIGLALVTRRLIRG